MPSWTTNERRSANRGPAFAQSFDWPAALLQLTDAALAGVIFLVPFLLGGRHDVGRFAFAALASTAGIAWFGRQALLGRRSHIPRAILALLGAAAVLLLLQLTPLPTNVIAWLAPRIPAVLPLWSGAAMPGALGAWTTLTVDPEATRLSLAMLAAYGLLLVTVLERIETPRDATRFLTWIGLAAAFMAAIGLVQYALPNGKFLWIYDHPTRDAGQRLAGAFANRNHFAHFLALGVPALAICVATKVQLNNFRLPPLGGSNEHGRPQSRPSAGGSPCEALGWGGGKQQVPASPKATNIKTLAIAAALILTPTAAILSCSRGGALALATSTAVIAIALWRAGYLRGNRLALVGAAALAVFLAIAAIGYDQVAERLGTLTSESLDELDAGHGRRRIWEANIAAIRDGGLLGAGAGTHGAIYPLYTADPPGKHYTHAESGYLQIVTETGVAGGILLAAALALVAYACTRALRRADSPEALALAGACTAMLAASVVHSTCDFVWYIPACLAPTLIALACVWRLGSFGVANSLCEAKSMREGSPTPMTASTPKSISKQRGIGVGDASCNKSTRAPWQPLPWAAAATLAALFAIAQLLPPARAASHWDAYLRMAAAHRKFTAQNLAHSASAAASPAEAAARRLESQQAELAAFEAMIRELESVVRRQPTFAAAHEMLANRCVQLFNLRMDMSDNRMPLSQFRDCAAQQNFQTAAELRAWLARASSGNHELLYEAWSHARLAAALAPLEGDAYVRLGELCFLQGAHFPEADAYLHQALLARPNDGNLWFEVGAQWGARGVHEWMWPAWVRAFAIPGPHRANIARALAGHVPVAELLPALAPEWDTLPDFWQAIAAAELRNATTSASQEVTAFLTYAQQQATREAPSARPAKSVYIWRSLAQMQRTAGAIDQEIASLIEACRVVPEDYQSRRLLGLALADAHRDAEANAQLRWCLGRKPKDAAVAAALVRINRNQLAASEANTEPGHSEVPRGVQPAGFDPAPPINFNAPIETAATRRVPLLASPAVRSTSPDATPHTASQPSSTPSEALR